VEAAFDPGKALVAPHFDGAPSRAKRPVVELDALGKVALCVDGQRPASARAPDAHTRVVSGISKRRKWRFMRGVA
jgi:hypothetical protein